MSNMLRIHIQAHIKDNVKYLKNIEDNDIDFSNGKDLFRISNDDGCIDDIYISNAVKSIKAKLTGGSRTTFKKRPKKSKNKSFKKNI